jgi:hypothetical protein
MDGFHPLLSFAADVRDLHLDALHSFANSCDARSSGDARERTLYRASEYTMPAAAKGDSHANPF